MGPTGITKIHVDSNDFATFLFIIQQEDHSGGGLEIIGCDLCFSSNVGDAYLFDADKLRHQPRQFSGVAENRLMGAFIVHKTYLKLLGINT